MSMQTLPLVFINLGGEMLYILNQRMKSESTEDGPDRGLWTEGDRSRVLTDIVGTLFSRSFMDELFEPQQLYSHRTLKTVLSKIVHSSILRLNPPSVDRLYELMVMVFKYQILLSPRPKDLLLVSYNHLDSIRLMVQETPATCNLVQETHRRVIETYTSLNPGQLQLLRQTLLIFFEDHRIRVSLLLKKKIQNPDGRFVLSPSGSLPHGVRRPGTIRVFDSRGREVQCSEFPPGGDFSSSREGSFDLSGDRGLRLGLNIFSEETEETQVSGSPSDRTESRLKAVAKDELNLLSRLMGTLQSGSGSGSGPVKSFRINLFPSDREEDEAAAVGGAEPWAEIHIQALQDVSDLSFILGQFSETEDSEVCDRREDLLQLMDTHCS